MDKKFLNKVVGHIVKETIMDYVQKTIITPYSPLSFPSYLLPSSPSLLPPTPSPLPHFYLFSPFSLSSSFTQHCKNIYGLKPAEIEYTYEQYRNTIKDKINEQEVSK